jgi:hypothetical protein
VNGVRLKEKGERKKAFGTRLKAHGKNQEGIR